MFKILNRNREVVGLITSPINPIIEDNLTGMNELKFSVPATQEGLELEGYIRIENEHEYVIKEISTHGHNREVIAIMNVEELIGKVWTTFRSVDTYPTACIREIVAGTGWTVVDNCPPNKKRNLYGTQISSWDLIFLACDVWGIEVKFDTHNKVITTQEKGGTDRGTYFMSDLNLKQLMHDSHTHKLITRVIPIGKDGLTIEKVNGGKNYISNHSYSNKVITGIWQSDRYTKAQDLMDDAREYLAEMCVPYESYECKVSDLYRLEKNPNFEFNVGDVIYLIDNITKKKIQQRIIKHTKNLTSPDKDTINLANKSMSFTDYYKRLQLIANMTEQAIGSDGLISNGSIESVDADKITGDIKATLIDADTIISEHIKADQILAGHIKADQIYGEHIVSDEIDTRHLKADSIKAEHIDVGQIEADHIQAGAIQTGHIDVGSINAGHIQSGSINSNHILSGSIGATHLQANSIEAGHINANSINTDHLQSGSITTQHLQANSITSDHIQTGAITAGSSIIAEGAIGSAQISSLDANKIDAGEINTAKVKIKGENGFLFIENNTLYVVDNNRKIRCELGVIENNSNYGFVVRGADGQTIMLDHRGVHNAGITDGAIDNRKVSENANISGKKLDIDSVVKSINEDGSVTLQGTKVQIGNTTLDVKLSEQNNLITEQGQRLATQQSEITANTNAIKLKVDNQTYTEDKENMTSSLNKATSDISVLQGQIALKVEQTDITNAVNTLSGTVDKKITDAKAEIKATTDSITQRVSSTESTLQTTTNKVDNLQVGGRNLLLNTKKGFVLSQGHTNAFAVSSYKSNVDSTGELTVSFDVVGDTKMHFDMYFVLPDGTILNNDKYLFPAFKIDEVGKVYKFKATGTANGIGDVAYIRVRQNTSVHGSSTHVGTLTISNMKLEVGNKATDYTVAPEDIDSSISSVDSKVQTTNNKVASIETNLNGITQRVSSTESTVSSHTTQLGTVDSRINTAKNSAISTASSDATTKANNALASAKTDATTKANNALADAKTYTNGQITTVNTTINNKVAEIKATTDAITQRVASTESKTTTLTTQINNTQTSLNSLAIGGRNYALNSDKEKKADTTYLSYEISPLAKTELQGKVVTVSFEAKKTSGTANLYTYFRQSSGFIYPTSDKYGDITTEYKRYSFTFTAPADLSNAIQIAVHTENSTGLQVRNIKVERGHRATDWTPSTEDVQGKIDTAQSTADGATTKANNAQTTANTANAQATTNKNNISSLTTTVTNTNNKVSSLETNLSSITSRVSATESNLTTTTKKLDNLQVGGRNYVLSSNTEKRPSTSDNTFITYNISTKVQTELQGKVVTISFEAKKTSGTANMYAYLRSNGGSIAPVSGTIGDITTSYKRYSVTFTAPSDLSNAIQVGIHSTNDVGLYVRNAKLEKGNMPTDWTPASEDMETTVSNLTTRVSNAESKLTKDSLTTTIGSHYTTSTDVNNAITSKGYATTSQVQQTKNELTASFKESGGYNLLYNGDFSNGTENWANNGGYLYSTGLSSPTGKGIGFSGELLKTKYIHQTIDLDPYANSYTISCYMHTSSGGSDGSTNPFRCLYLEVCWSDDSITYLTTKNTVYNTWQKVHITVTRSNLAFKSIGVFGYCRDTTKNVYFTDFMVEKGSVANIWAPNPNEVFAGVTKIDKNGIQVSQSNIATTTKMNANGFYINKGGTDVFKVDSGGLRMTGNITGSTFSSANNIFQVLSDGTVETDDINVSGTVSTDALTVNKISNPRYPEVLDRAMTVYIKNGATSSDEFYHGAVFGSFKDMLAVAPRNLQGYTLDIVMQSNITENVSLTWFTSGQVDISFQGFTLYGYLYCYGASMVYRLYGGNSDATKIGKIMPSCGRSMGSYYYALAFQYCQFAVNNIGLYPDTTNTTNSGGICANRGARGNIFDATAYGSMRYLVRSEYGSHVYVGKTSGTCNNATFCASTGSIISINNDNTQAGRSTSGNPYWVGSGGMIVNNQLLGMSNITFGTTANSGSNTNTSTGSSQTVTETITASLADTYRSTVYNNWKKDGTVRQGDWGYGNCTGLWFFDNKLSSALAKGTTKSVSIKITRQSGGNSGAVTHTLKVHNHATRPSGAPTMGSTITTFSLATGASTTLNLTSAQINTLKSGKGIGLQSSYSNSTYSVCSGTITIKVTYTT